MDLLAEQPVHADLQRVVGDHGQDPGRHPGRPAQAEGDVGVERARAAGVPGHRHEPDREHQQHDPGGQIADRGADAADEHGQRGDAGHHGQRRGRRDDQEGDRADAERVRLEVVGRRRDHAGRPVFGADHRRVTSPHGINRKSFG